MSLLFALLWTLTAAFASRPMPARPSPGVPDPPAKTIQVRTNKNIELFGLIMSLDLGPDLVANKDTVTIENRKATWREWYATSYKLYIRYKKFDSVAIMQRYRSMVANGCYNDFFIGLLVQVDEVPYAKVTAATDRDFIQPFAPTGSLEEATQKANEFLQELNRFYTDLHFGDYLRENQPYYTRIESDVRKNLPDSQFIPIMEAFYGKQFNAYYLVPSLNTPTSMGFGKMDKTTRTIFNTFGPFHFQTFDKVRPQLGFDDSAKIAELSVHEFGHSFVNPAIDKLPDTLKAATLYLYERIRAEMSKRAYTSWSMCLYEHFVKAGEVIIARKLGHPDKADKMMQAAVEAKFIYVPFIVKELETYDSAGASERNYDDYVRKVMEDLKAANPSS